MRDIFCGISYILGVSDRFRSLIMMRGRGVNNYKRFKLLVCYLYLVLVGIENVKMKKVNVFFCEMRIVY